MAKKQPLTKEQWDKQGLKVPNSPQTSDEKVALVESLPATVKQIHVCDESGCSVWRKPGKILASDTIVFRKSGLPNLRVAKVGAQDEEDAIAQRIKEREEFTTSDTMVRTAKHSMDPDDVNRQALIRMTEVTATMQFERLQAELEGESIDTMLMREMRALKTLSDAASKQVDQRLKRQEIDLGSMAFKTIVANLLRTFKGQMVRSGLSNAQANQIVSSMAELLDTEEWQMGMSKAIAGD